MLAYCCVTCAEGWKLLCAWLHIDPEAVLGAMPAQAKAYRIADNQTAALSQWDDDKLPLELADLQGMDFDLNLTGFSPKSYNACWARKRTTGKGLTAKPIRSRRN
jgi:hypothetical protein